MPFGKAFVHQAPKRKKTEVFWSGITGLTLTADTDYNLVALLKALPARRLAPWPCSSTR